MAEEYHFMKVPESTELLEIKLDLTGAIDVFLQLEHPAFNYVPMPGTAETLYNMPKEFIHETRGRVGETNGKF